MLGMQLEAEEQLAGLTNHNAWARLRVAPKANAETNCDQRAALSTLQFVAPHRSSTAKSITQPLIFVL